VPDYKQFKLPDPGEGLTEAEILSWLVKPGDTVQVNQTIVEIETAKAAVELPSPYAGVVTELHVAEGDTVDVGTPIITFDVAPDGAAAPEVEQPPAGEPPATAEALRDDMAPDIPQPSTEQPSMEQPSAEPPSGKQPSVESPAPDQPVEPGLIGGPAPGGRTSVLVGYGPRSVVAKRRPRKAPAGSGPAGGAGTAPAPPATRPTEVSVLAKPPVRKLAKDLGVDLQSLTGSGPNGVITRADVEAAAEPAEQAPVAAERPAAVWDTSREQRIPIKGVRKHTAAAMVASAFTAPHVTEFVTIDMTPTIELRDRVATLPDFAGIKVSPLLFVAKALLLAVRRHPLVNSSWDEQAQEIVVKEYVNLGIAAATSRGLIVPNIKDAGLLSLRELAVALADLTETARAGKTTPADMAGGTITITNVGVFGVDTGTPILNPGEAAILAFGAVRPAPWVVDGQLAVRQVTQLALSFDHRIIDGQLGSEFLADVAAVLSDPTRALAWG
jgi:2-oxoisovalerate dehydrogenase E2 component (dihydrolipoyl transacylase)